MTTIWLPNVGDMNLDEAKVHRAVQAYDERVMFGRNKDTGDYCLFILMPRPMEPIALFGWQYVPTPEEAVERLSRSDLQRRGDEIWRDIEHSMKAFEKEKKDIADEHTAEMAERLEFELRKNKGTKSIHWEPK